MKRCTIDNCNIVVQTSPVDAENRAASRMLCLSCKKVTDWVPTGAGFFEAIDKAWDAGEVTVAENTDCPEYPLGKAD